MSIRVETADDKIEQLQSMVVVAEEALTVEERRFVLTDRQVEQNAALASSQAEAHAKSIPAQASFLETKLGPSSAQEISSARSAKCR